MVCLDILSELKYLHTERIFDSLIRLAGEPDQIIKEKAVEVLSKLAMYNMHVLQKIGILNSLLLINLKSGQCKAN